MPRFIYIVVSVIAFIALAVGVFFTSGHFASKWESERLVSASLIDSSGNPWQLSQLEDKIGIVYFGYTYCPDVCPTALNDLAIALNKMGTERSQFKPIFISVDPARDTLPMIKEYVAHFDKDILGLTGSTAELKSFSFNFGATYSLQKKGPDDEDYIVNHTANFFLATSNGKRLPLPLKDNPDDLREVIFKVKNKLLEM